VVLSIELDRGRIVADPDMPAVAAGAFVRISSRSVELDRFLANLSMVTLIESKVISNIKLPCLSLPENGQVPLTAS
jgi:hypothetical protein